MTHKVAQAIAQCRPVGHGDGQGHAGQGADDGDGHRGREQHPDAFTPDLAVQLRVIGVGGGVLQEREHEGGEAKRHAVVEAPAVSFPRVPLFFDRCALILL